MLNRLLATSRGRWLTVAAVYAVAALVTVCCGTLRNTNTFLFDYDTRFWFLGGVMWLRGDSPYELESFLQLWRSTFGEPPRFRAGFVYPGTILPLSLLLGPFQWETARQVMRVVNFAAWAGALLALRTHFVRGGETARARGERDLCVGAAAAVPGVALTMFQGQTALLVTVGLCLAWVGLRSRRTGLAVVGVFLACMKPQLAIVAVLFLVACFRDRRAWLGLAAAAAASAVVLLWTTPARFAADLAASLAEHTAQEFNSPDNYDSLVARLGTTGLGRVSQWIGVLGACGVAVALGTWARTARLLHAEIRLFQMALASTAVLVPVHRYDLAIHLPLIATAWALNSWPRAASTFLLVLAHGWSTSVCWHLWEKFGIAVDYHTLAGGIATVQLLTLVAWWHRDSRREGSWAGQEPRAGVASGARS